MIQRKCSFIPIIPVLRRLRQEDCCIKPSCSTWASDQPGSHVNILSQNNNNKEKANKMAQWVKELAKKTWQPEFNPWNPRLWTQKELAPPPQIVLWPPHMCCGTHTHSHLNRAREMAQWIQCINQSLDPRTHLRTDGHGGLPTIPTLQRWSEIPGPPD